jgi:hypothetical protein
LRFDFFHDKMIMAFFRGLEKAPTFLVPIINPPFADNSPQPPPEGAISTDFAKSSDAWTSALYEFF